MEMVILDKLNRPTTNPLPNSRLNTRINNHNNNINRNNILSLNSSNNFPIKTYNILTNPVKQYKVNLFIFLSLQFKDSINPLSAVIVILVIIRSKGRTEL